MNGVQTCALPISLPAAGLTLPSLAAVAGLASAVGVALALLWWARRRLDGLTGDVIGAANELARAAALHAGLVVWHAGVESPVAPGEVVGWTLS